MKKQYLKAVFKSYNQKQLMLLPPSLDEIIEGVSKVQFLRPLKQPHIFYIYFIAKLFKKSQGK